jgi:hypothetical protein
MSVQQLSVDIENEPGRLYTITDALAAAGVNIRALTVVDRDGMGVARMLVSDVKKAREVVLALDFPARTDDVLVVAIPDEPGSLAAMLEPLYDAYMNVRYLEAFSEINGRAVAILRFDDNAAAREMLVENGHVPLTHEQLFTAPPAGSADDD